jgi:hypothetical protein
MTDSYRATIIRTENLIRVKPLCKTTHGLAPKVSPHFTDALLVEKLNFRPVSVILNLPVSIQKLGDNGGDAALLRANRRM